ncbi:hypothetical protein HZY86_00530 [Aerococcaceae bacterium DSM 111020]|nr:hypothetical protein [Aerococcaceae bacterium DSM 111020]
MSPHGYRSQSKDITLAALLTAFGILIPLLMPFKVIIGPASYTLGSHIPINIALFHSGTVGAIVSIGTTLGFLMAGFPIVITLRALSHIIYVLFGHYLILKGNPHLLASTVSRSICNIGINLIHALGEVIVVYLLTSGDIATQSDYFYTLFVLVGVGTLIHGCIDFELSYLISRMIQQRTSIQITNLDL